jgi:hypothetical protein
MTVGEDVGDGVIVNVGVDVGGRLVGVISGRDVGEGTIVAELQAESTRDNTNKTTPLIRILLL